MARRVTIKGLSGLQADLDEISADLVAGMPKAEEAVAEALGDLIRNAAPVDTGALRSSVETDGSEVHVGGSRAPYADEVEDNDPFIQPSIAKILRDGDEVAADVLRKEIG
jgi:hypothetical protein